MNVFVTGANGYIGSNVVKGLLQAGHQVVALVRPNASIQLLESVKDKIKFSFYKGSFECLQQALLKHQPDIVFHLASCFIAEHQSNQINALLDANIRFGLHLLEAMKEAGVTKLINTGTSWQYYNNDVEGYQPVCLYAATKQAFEDLAYFYHQAHHLSVINLILYDTYGPHDPRKKLFYLFKQASQSQEPILMSPGEQKIDLVYVDDVVQAYLVAMNLFNTQKTLFQNYAIRTNFTYSLKKIAAIFCQIYQVSLNIKWGGRSYRKREVMAPYSKIQSVPTWQAKVELIQGLEMLKMSA